MAFFKNARALRAAILACGMVWLGPAGISVAGPAGIPYGRSRRSFRTSPSACTSSRSIAGVCSESGLGSPTSSRTKGCSLPFAMATASVVYQRPRSNFSASSIVAGSATAGPGSAEINRAINLAIRPMEDLVQYGEVDVWSSPLVTFNTGAGDCEDYAIAKYVALQMAGIPAEDLRIVVVLDLNGEGHAVASVRLDGNWLILDNQRMAMVEDVNARAYRPRFVIDESGVMEYSDAPMLISAPERNNKRPVVTTAAQPGSMTPSK